MIVRCCTTALLLLAGIALLAAPIAAQDASPVADPEEMGFHELTITSDDGAFDIPATVPAGRTLLTMVNDSAENLHDFIVRLPEGSGPEIMAEITVTFPEWFINGLLGTADFVPPGGRVQVVIDLLPGLHLIARVAVPGSVQQVQPFVVAASTTPTGESVADPLSDITITMVDFAFRAEPDLAAAPLKAGRYWLKVINAGEFEHEFEVAKVPAGTTEEDVAAAFAMEGTPVPAGQLDLTRQAKITTEPIVGGMGLLSPGVTGWLALDLEPGTYVAYCPIPDFASGHLHSQLGMFTVFTVEA